jgi:hypothetical protein
LLDLPGRETYSERWIRPGMDWWTRSRCRPMLLARSPATLPQSHLTLCLCQVEAASVFPSGNQIVRLPVSGPGLPDRMSLACQGSFDGHPWLWLPIKNHGKDSYAILTHRPCTIGLTRRKLQRPPQVIAVCWHPPSGLGYCPRPSPRARPSSVAPGDFPAASPRLPHPFHNYDSALLRCSMGDGLMCAHLRQRAAHQA